MEEYLSRFERHIYHVGHRAYQIEGVMYEYNVRHDLEAIMVFYNVISIDSDGKATGIQLNGSYRIYLWDDVQDKLQYVKVQINQRFSRNSKSIKKKYWTKLIRGLQSTLKKI